MRRAVSWLSLSLSVSLSLSLSVCLRLSLSLWRRAAAYVNVKSRAYKGPAALSRRTRAQRGRHVSAFKSFLVAALTSVTVGTSCHVPLHSATRRQKNI